MRILSVIIASAIGLALSACATGPATDRYTTDYDRLRADCDARGGILSPTGSTSGRPQLDNVCQIRGETGRAPAGG